jgi:hypothetical protein
MIQKAKAEYWVEWLEGLDKTSIWKVSRLVTLLVTDAGKTRIPTLQVKDPVTKKVVREAADNNSKGKLFYETFFPPLNPAPMLVPQDYQYPLP